MVGWEWTQNAGLSRRMLNSKAQFYCWQNVTQGLGINKHGFMTDWGNDENDETQKIMGTGRDKYRDRTTDVLD